MCNYKCPFAERRKCAGFLLCRAMEKDGVNYNDRKNALGVICLFQKQCMKTGMMENSDGAERCYKDRRHWMTAEAAVTAVEATADDPKVEEEPGRPEEIPVEAPKKGKKKKTE